MKVVGEGAIMEIECRFDWNVLSSGRDIPGTRFRFALNSISMAICLIFFHFPRDRFRPTVCPLIDICWQVDLIAAY